VSRTLSDDSAVHEIRFQRAYTLSSDTAAKREGEREMREREGERERERERERDSSEARLYADLLDPDDIGGRTLGAWTSRAYDTTKRRAKAGGLSEEKVIKVARRAYAEAKRVFYGTQVA